MIEETKIENEWMGKKKRPVWVTVVIILAVFFVLLWAAFLAFAIYHKSSDKIMSGVQIRGIDVSHLTMEQATEKVKKVFEENMPENVTIQYTENVEVVLSIQQMEAKFDIDGAVKKAYQTGREGNLFQNNFTALKGLFIKENIDPTFTVNEEQLIYMLEDISTKLPDTVVQSSYYIDGTDLVITKGKKGNIVNVDQMKQEILEAVKNLTYKDQKLTMATLTKDPDTIDIDKIHQEIYKQPVSASYTKDPFVVHPSENGVDFKISVEEAKALLAQEGEECVIPLKVIRPEVTTNMIGSEAFPDLISSFSTNYNSKDKDRTTNLRLAAEKINGVVLMPGETFSYNQTVGKRTIDAGYKEAKIYENGQVVDGLGGGICQISTTLYNAVIYANLQIVERRNHQFVPSYVTAGRDATVVYGSTDFRFKNTRNYPVKLEVTVNGGVAKFNIFGLREQNEYEVEITSNVTSKTATNINSIAYKILKQNGAVVSKEVLSKDTYKRH